MTDSPIHSDWSDEWTINLRARLADSSVSGYLRSLRQFSDWLPDDGETVHQVTRQHVEGWMASLTDGRKAGHA